MLSATEKDRFMEEGYLVIPDLVPDYLCQEVIDTIVDYLGLNLNEPESWYSEKHEGHGIVPLHHAQSLWNIRQLESIHEVYSDLYATEKLWVTMDRASYKPPLSEHSRDYKKAPLHWDCDPWTYDGLGVQGLVYLTDTEAHQGAFCCVPSLYKNLQSYLRDNADDDQARWPRVDEKDVVRVPGTQGSLVLFHRLMPHSSGLNQSASHRFVQYVAMEPEGNKTLRQQRIENWRECLPPQWAIRQKIEAQQIPEPGPAADLTDLGRKLVGIDSW